MHLEVGQEPEKEFLIAQERFDYCLLQDLNGESCI